MIKANVDTKKFLAELGKIQGGLHQATARTINSMGKRTINRYKQLIESEYEIRTNFTRNALKMFPATYERKSKPGELRPLRDINALLYIRNIKGKTHYLVIQEEGLAKSQHKSADDKVSIPVAGSSRSGGSTKGKVSPKYSLRKGGVQNLKIGQSAADFGVRGDGFSDKQRWAILKKYQDGNPYGWDLRKPFRLTYGQNTDAYAKKGSSIVLMRLMRDKSRYVKRRPLFEKAFNEIDASQAQQIFNTVAERILR